MTASRPSQAEVKDKEATQSAESHDQIPSQDIDRNINISQSHPTDPGPNDVTMLRVLFQTKRPLPAMESETTLIQSPITQSLDGGSTNYTPRDVEIDKLRDELREAKVKLVKANNDQKRLRFTVESLEKELANVYTDVQSELGIWEKELLELRPLREEIQTLRLASHSSGIRMVWLEKENRNLREELMVLKEGVPRKAEQGDATDSTESSNTSGSIISNHKVSVLQIPSPVIDNRESKIPGLDTFLELEDDCDPSNPAPAAFVSNAGKILGVPSSVYPEGIRAPRADLVIGAGHGFFRYDHNFLMQFQRPCKDIPSEASSNISLLGLDHDGYQERIVIDTGRPGKKNSKNASVKQNKKLNIPSR